MGDRYNANQLPDEERVEALAALAEAGLFQFFFSISFLFCLFLLCGAFVNDWSFSFFLLAAKLNPTKQKIAVLEGYEEKTVLVLDFVSLFGCSSYVRTPSL
jgi:hypothetical protein